MHIYQRFIQHAPVYLDAKLNLRGEITAIEKVAKGEVVRWAFDISDETERKLVTVDRAGLRPQKTRTANSGATDFVKPPEEIQPGFENIWRRTLVPEEVARYSNDGRNKIHSDLKIACQFGFRAPIAAGLNAAVVRGAARATGRSKNGSFLLFLLFSMFFPKIK